MLNSLNKHQRAAVESTAQALLIIAGPGTGKTHTITCRIIRQSESLGPAQKILAITFTRKAADEMRSRVSQNIKEFESKVFIGTFHQFCISLLQKYLTGDFSIASDQKSLDIAKTIWPGLTPSEYKKRLEEISRHKSVGFRNTPEGFISEFNHVLRTKRLYDFDGLILEALRLLESDEAVLSEVRSMYPRICVDEYQDLNRIQHELLKILVGEKSLITAIGDPNQAIYGFRGSDVKFFHSFKDDFKDAKILWLRDNYRNAQDVLAASSQIIESAGDQDVPKQIAQIYDQGLLTIHESSADKAEAEFVVHTIEQLIGGTSMFSQDSGRVDYGQDGEISFGDVAVLYRLKSQGRELKKAFERSGMPIYIVGETNADQDIAEDLVMQRHDEPDLNAEKISLMTLHAAKGLEFRCVFICGCEEGLLPLDIFDMQSDPEEERRLFYVGMTRAKHRLYLTCAKKRMLYGKTFHNSPTVFFKDIEESLKKYSRSQFKKKDIKEDEQMTFF